MSWQHDALLRYGWSESDIQAALLYKWGDKAEPVPPFSVGQVWVFAEERDLPNVRYFEMREGMILGIDHLGEARRVTFGHECLPGALYLMGKQGWQSVWITHRLERPYGSLEGPYGSGPSTPSWPWPKVFPGNVGITHPSSETDFREVGVLVQGRGAPFWMRT
jgi:hypothetical protein